MTVFTRGVRNTFRNGIRTFSIIVILALSIALSVSMLVARQAVQTKIQSVKSSVGTTISISPAGARGFEGGGEALTTEQIAKVSATTHVSSVDSQLSDRFTADNTSLQSAIEAGSLGRRFSMNNGSTTRTDNIMPPSGTAEAGKTFTPPVTATGTNATNPLSVVGEEAKLTSGTAFTGTSTDDVALVGAALAEKNNLQVGSTFTAYGKTITVAGIYDAGTTFGNAGLLMPLAALQTVSDQTGNVTSATVHVDSLENVSSATEAVKTTLGDAADVTNQQEAAQAALAPLESVKRVSVLSLYGAVLAGAVILLLVMVMIVRERRREIGVLKAIGASNIRVVAQFMSEAITFTLLAAVLGLLIGAAASSPITEALVNNTASSAQSAEGMGGRPESAMMRGGAFISRASNTIDIKGVHAAVGWEVLVLGLVVALAIAVIASAAAAFMIGKIRPAEVMRAE